MSGSHPAVDPIEAPTARGSARCGRRRWLAGALAVALAPFLARRGAASEPVGYGCGPGCDDPAALALLAQVSGLSFAVERLGADDRALATLAKSDGGIDLFVADASLIEQAAARGLARPLAGAPIERIGADLRPALRSPFAPLLHDGLAIALPVRWGWIGPVVDAAAIDPAGWRDYAPVFDPKHQGRIGALASSPWLPLAFAQHAGIDPFAPLDADGAEELRRVLRAFLKNRPVLFDKAEAAAKALADGSLDALIGAGSQLAARLRGAGGGDWRALAPTPRDGMKQTLLWVEAAAIHAAADAPEAAMAALVALFDPAVGHALSLAAAGPAPSASEAVAATYAAAERSLLQLDDADAAWERGRLRRPVPDPAALQAIWDKIRASAA
jgi:spermidine/putrescine-binding protein